MSLALQSQTESQPGHWDFPFVFKHLTPTGHSPLLFLPSLCNGGLSSYFWKKKTKKPVSLLLCFKAGSSPGAGQVPSTSCRSLSLEARPPQPPPLPPTPHSSVCIWVLQGKDGRYSSPHTPIPFLGLSSRSVKFLRLTESLLFWKEEGKDKEGEGEWFLLCWEDVVHLLPEPR